MVNMLLFRLVLKKPQTRKALRITQISSVSLQVLKLTPDIYHW